jgi:hypothetical protein
MLRKDIFALFSGALLLVFCSAAFGQCAGHVQLNEYEQNRFIEHVYSDQEQLFVELLSAESCGPVMVASLRDFGASIRFVDEKIGYALVRLPKEKILPMLDLPAIAYALVASSETDVADRYNLPQVERKATPIPAITIHFPQVASSVPSDGPYFAADEAGLTALWRDHPEADGRGVRIAVVDSGLDLLHPALQVARDVNANLVPKVADITTSSSPERDTNWVQFGDLVLVTNGRFLAAEAIWTAPMNGAFRFGIFSKQLILGKQPNSDLRKAEISVGVLWDEQSNRVWVDTDGDRDFRNQRALGNYAETNDVDYFGSKENDTDNRIPFGIKIDRVRRAVYLSIADGYHGAYIAGSLGANRLTGGLFDGAAPSAQLIDVRVPTRGGDKIDFVPQLLDAFARKDVDVINLSGTLGRPWNREQDFYRHVQERATTVYDKPIVCLCEATNALEVQDYQSAEMLRRNRRTPPPYVESMNSVVFFNPIGLVNNVIAPSANLITQSRYVLKGYYGEDGLYQVSETDIPVPRGYDIGDNPSPTIPVVSGILADLISEARRKHIRYNVVRLVQAVMTSTRMVRGFLASEQGYGLVNAAGAWNQLAKMADADDPGNPVLTSFTVFRSRGENPSEVSGFSADTPKAGGVLHGDLWITRRGGYSGARDYALSLRGDKGTYTLFDHKTRLVRDQPVRVRFAAKITSGFHVAFLQLRDAKADVIMQEVPLSLRVPQPPKMLALGVEEYESAIPPRHVKHFYVRLGEQTQAARFVTRMPYEGRHINQGWLPGLGRMYPNLPSGDSVDAAHHVGAMVQFESLIANDEPEPQEILWANRGFAEYEGPRDDPAPNVPIAASLTVEKYAIAFAKRDSQSLLATNKLAEINGRVELCDATLVPSKLIGSGSHDLATLQRTLPAHLSQWRVSVSSPGQSTVDAFLLDCTGSDGCSVAEHRVIASGASTLVVDDPKQGDWRLVVRTRDPIELQHIYHVREALLVPNISGIEANDAKHATGTTWSVSLPPKQTDAQYVAFRIAGTVDSAQAMNETGRQGLRIAMTPVTPGAP